jgi:membrane fusion protein, multidrug efflux system
MTRMMTTLVAACLAAGCTASATPEKPARPVRVASIEPPAPAGAARYSAQIVAATEVALAFRSSGYVETLRQGVDPDGRPRDIQAGDMVPANVTLARVRDVDYRARVAQAEAQAHEAVASLQKAGFDRDRAETLFAAESLTRPELDSARLAMASSEARVQASRAELDLARIALDDAALKSPFAGLVIERKVEQGSLVSAGLVGFVVADVRTVKAVFGVPDAVAAAVRVGAPLTVTSDSLHGRAFAGRVTGVAPSADPQTRVFNIEVTVANPDRALKPGMIATVEVEPAGGRTPRPASGAAVPLAAVVRAADDDGFAVFVVESDSGHSVARERAVTLGEVAGNAIAVPAGVAAGEQVIVSGAALIKDGDIVRVIP